MNGDSMYLDPEGVYHGDANCPSWDEEGRRVVYEDEYGSEREHGTFTCTNCRREMCWCAGHAGAGVRMCPVNCSKCDDCCVPDEEFWPDGSGVHDRWNCPGCPVH